MEFKKTIKKWLWVILIPIIACVLFLFTYNLFSDNIVYYIEIKDYPVKWNEHGLGKEYLRSTIFDNFSLIKDEAKNKLSFIINEKYHVENDLSYIDEQLSDEVNSLAVEFSVFQIDVLKSLNLLNMFIRSLMNKQDLKIDISITDKDDYRAKIKYKDNKNDNKTEIITIYKNEYDKDKEDELIKKCAYYIYGIQHPLESILYDFEIDDEIIDQYVEGTPWKNLLYAKEVKEKMLLDYTLTNNLNSAFGYLLLGNMYEYSTNENDLNQCLKFYQSFIERDSTYKDKIEYKIELIKKRISNNRNKESDIDHVINVNDIEVLNNAGLIKLDSTINQLVIVTDPYVLKGITYKAKMALFERNQQESWEQVIFKEPVDVNLSKYGLIPAGKKVEGDYKVPAGFFSIPFAFGLSSIETGIPFEIIDDRTYWISDETNKDYNTMQRAVGDELNGRGNEKLASPNTLELYEYAVVIGHNMFPKPVKGKGSAIFIHVEREKDSATGGCISMSKEQIVSLIHWLDKANNPHIYIGEMP